MMVQRTEDGINEDIKPVQTHGRQITVNEKLEAFTLLDQVLS